MPDKIFELAFETHPAIATEQFEYVGTPEIGIVKVKKIGCLTPNEKLAWERYILSKQNDLKLLKVSEGEITIEIVTLMLQSRYKSDWNRASTENIQNYPLVEALFRFFDKERSSWEPTWDLKIEGVGAKKVAVDYAREHKGVVLYREDIALTYLVVMDELHPSLLEWRIIEDFRESITKPNTVTGKSKK